MRAFIDSLPPRLLFVDVETTGLHSSDRVVSVGMVEVETAPLRQGVLEATSVHLIFDPGRKSHPRAEEVHGYSDWTLRHQEPFSDYADELAAKLARADMIAAHNAPFDERFLRTEFDIAGRPLDPRPFHCTMADYRSRVGGRAGLNAAVANIGISRTSARHGALEDAWLAMAVFFWMHGVRPTAGWDPPATPPTNLKPVPPVPDGKLPRRQRRAGKRPHTSVADSELAATLAGSAKPMALCLMWIAQADGLHQSELSVMEELVSETAGRLGLQPPSEAVASAAATLFDLRPQLADVDKATSSIMRDEALRDLLAGWVQRMVYADGRGSPAEALAISRLRESIARSTA